MELETGAERSKDGSCDFVIHLCALCILNPFQICASLLAAVKKLFLKKFIVFILAFKNGYTVSDFSAVHILI